MATLHYISIREFCDFHSIDTGLIDEIIEFGLFVPKERDKQPCIPEEEIGTLETILRLHTELGVNWAGIETILYMRERLQQLQQQKQELEQQLREFQQFFESGYR
ncbi:MAG: hypothetical protein DHS20C18_31490 [Saprospiraceae bacterium]|nr:MAG: hypothetical protein DHS20C18_31490 [Saprospiraceae bacterium]